MIIVLDGGSVDNTKQLIEDYVLHIGKDSPEIILVDNPETCCSQARNIALEMLPKQKRWNTLLKSSAIQSFPKHHIQTLIDCWEK